MWKLSRVVAGGLGAAGEECGWVASVFVECEGVLGGQFLMAVRMGAVYSV